MFKPLTPAHKKFIKRTSDKNILLVAPLAQGRTTAALLAADRRVRERVRPVYALCDTFAVFKVTINRTHKDMKESLCYPLNYLGPHDPWPEDGICIVEGPMGEIPIMGDAGDLILTDTRIANIARWQVYVPQMTVYIAPRVRRGAPEDHLPDNYYQSVLRLGLDYREDIL